MELLSVSTSGQEVGDTATYSCRPGYRLIGAATRTCLASGEWSGAPPRCQGESPGRPVLSASAS